MIKLFLALALIASFHSLAQGQTKDMIRSLSFEQNIGKKLSDDLSFIDEKENKTTFGQLRNGRPSIFVFSYAACESLCPLLLDNLVNDLRKIGPQAGRDFNVIFLSINPKESMSDIEKRKTRAILHFGRETDPEQWKFLRGTEDQILKTADTMGFHFKYDKKTKQFFHPAGIVFLTANGKVSSYLMGLQFRPVEIEKALKIAEAEKTGSLVEKVLVFCFHYDPTQSKYGPLIINSLRFASAFLLLFIAAGIIKLSTERRKA